MSNKFILESPTDISVIEDLYKTVRTEKFIEESQEFQNVLRGLILYSFEAVTKEIKAIPEAPTLIVNIIQYIDFKQFKDITSREVLILVDLEVARFMELLGSAQFIPKAIGQIDINKLIQGKD